MNLFYAGCVQARFFGSDANSRLRLEFADDVRKGEIAHAAEIPTDIKPYGS
jgi:hypothetical protein